MRGRGVSLAELMVSMAVGLLLLYAVSQVFVAGLHSFQFLRATADVEDCGIVALGRLTAEMRNSSFSTLTITNTPVATEFCIQTTPPGGLLIMYYWDQTGRRVMRKTWSGANGDVVLNPNPLTIDCNLSNSEMTALVDTANGTEQPVGTNVTSFSLSPSSWPQINPSAYPTSLTTMLTSSEPLNSTQSVTQTFVATVVFRNTTIATPTPTPSSPPSP